MAADLSTLLPNARVGVVADGVVVGEGRQLRVNDLGEAFEVRLGPEARVFSAERQCSERARTAAVWAAVRLGPELSFARSTPGPATATAGAGGRAWLPGLDLELGLAMIGAPEGGPVTGAGSVRIAVGVGPVALVVGGAVALPVYIPLAYGAAQLVRAPLDIDARLILARGRFRGAAEVGLALPVESAAGDGLSSSRSETRLAVGVRAGLRAGVALGRIAPYLGIAAVVEPSPYAIAVEGARPDTLLPRWWLDVELGVALTLIPRARP